MDVGSPTSRFRLAFPIVALQSTVPLPLWRYPKWCPRAGCCVDEFRPASEVAEQADLAANLHELRTGSTFWHSRGAHMALKPDAIRQKDRDRHLVLAHVRQERV